MIDSMARGEAAPRSARTTIQGVRMSFRRWRRSRPFWAGALGLLAGLPMWFFPSKAVQFLFVSRTPIWAGILVGVLVEAFALFLWIQPQHRALYGTLIVIFSLLSFITSDFGGLFVGMLLGILAGSLALAWTPVIGKTKRQRKWLAKAGVIVPDAEAIVHGEPLQILDLTAIEQPAVIEVEPVVLTEMEAATVPPTEAIEIEEPQVLIDITDAEAAPADEIDVTGWELPPDHAEDETANPTIDLREEKATTTPSPSAEPDDRGQSAPEG